MKNEKKKIFLICGEKSGNNIICNVLNKLKSSYANNKTAVGRDDDDNVDSNYYNNNDDLRQNSSCLLQQQHYNDNFFKQNDLSISKEKHDNDSAIDGEDSFELIGIVDDETAKKYNIKQIFSSCDISLIGIGDIITRIPYIIDKINFTAQIIIKYEPDLVISVDAYDFCIRVAKKVKRALRKKKRRIYNDKYRNRENMQDFTTNIKLNDVEYDNCFKDIKFCHIVAPTVWAYWSGRAKTLSKYYNHLFYLLPFEGKFFKPFERLGRSEFEQYEFKKDNFKQKNKFTQNEEFLTTFVGYPATFQVRDNRIKKDKNLIGITLGSRFGEINRHKDLIISTIMRLKMINNDYRFVIFATPDTFDLIKNTTRNISNIIIICDEREKQRVIQECQIVIAKSGTNNIEIGALGTAMVTYYKTSPITYLFAKIFSKTKLINLFNITLGEMAIPELIQKTANTDNLTKTVYTLLRDKNLIDIQLDKIQKAIALMQREDKKHPIDVIAETVLHFLKKIKL